MEGQSQSLWQSAMAKLDDADQKLLESDDDKSDSSAQLHVLEKFGQTTREAHRVCVEKRWSLKLRGGQKNKIIVRDLLGKIIRWVDVFKGIGDQAVAIDQVHTALPWAGARFLLQIAINDFAKFDFAVEGVEKIARMTARYGLVEMIYLGRITETTKQLEQAVVQLYASMLLFLAKAKRYFAQNTLVRVVKSGLLGKSDLYELLDKMDLHEREAERCATLVEAEMNKGTADQMKQVSDLRDALAKIDQPILQMSIKIERFEDHLDDLQRQKILDWLSIQRNGDHHKSIKDRVLTGTCGWIIQVPEFIKWQGDSTNSLLWLHGMQGVGKSCLTSVVIEDSMRLSQSDESCAVAYFYCSRDTSQPQRAEPQSILACIARQLSSAFAKHAIASPTIALHKSFHSTSGSREVPTIDEVIELILDLTNSYSRTTIVVDALDECDSVTRWKLIDALNNIVDNSDSLVKVFLSSREEGDLRLFIQDHTGVQVTGLQNGEDIRRFVEFETDRMVSKRQILSRIRKQSTQDELKQHIKDDVVSKANGMFRWAELQLASLQGIQFENDIRVELSRVPRELSILYEDIYSKTIERQKDTARAVLQNTLKWMMCSKELLSQAEFLQLTTAFLDVDIDEFDSEVILELLSNFITGYTNADGVQCFRFAHLSVLEFLENKPEYCIESINCFAAEVCILKVICCSGSPNATRFVRDMKFDIRTFTPSLETDQTHWYGFYNYSVEYWSEHCELAGEHNRSKGPQLHKLLQYLLFDNSDENCPMNSWWRSYRRIVGNLLRNAEMEIFFHNHGESYERAIFLASWFGFEEIVRMELRKPADSSLILHYMNVAVREKHYPILKILFDKTNDTQNLKYIIRQIAGSNDVHGLRECLNLLDPDNLEENLLFYAGSAEIVFMLLDHNKNLKITPQLVEQSPYGMSQAIGINPELVPELTITPGILSNACYLDFDYFKRIVDRVNPNLITCDVIASATFNDCSSARKTKLLLSLAGKIDVTEAAMIHAIMLSRGSEVVRNLLDHGWPVTQLVLEASALEGDIEGFQLIFEAGTFKVTSRLLELGAANFRRGGSIDKFLMSFQDEIPDDINWNRIILQYARRGVHGERLFSSLRPGMHLPEEVISIAFRSWDNYAIRDLLFNQNVGFEVTDHTVHAALKCRDYDTTVLEILRRHGQKVISCSMMQAAAQNCRFGDRMIGMLLNEGAKLESPSSKVVNAAICNDILGYEILQILESRFGKFSFSDTNLEHAAESGGLNTLKLILARMSTKGITPAVMLAAARSGHLSVLKYLLDLRRCPITVDMVIAAAGNEGAGAEKLKLIWDRALDIKPQVEMFLQLEGEDPRRADIFNFLLDRVEDQELYQQVLEAAVKSKKISSSLLVETMLEKKLPILFSQEILHDAVEAGQNGVVVLIMKHTTDIQITQDLLDLAIKHSDLGRLKLLRRYDNSQKLDFRQVDESITELMREEWVERVESCLES